jgi:signal transduction histidine kinase
MKSGGDLRRTRDRLRPPTDGVAAVVSVTGHGFCYVRVTGSYAAWIGSSPEEIVTRPVRQVIGSQAWETIGPYIQQVLSGHKVEYTARVNFAGRGYRWINAVYVPVYSRGGEVDGWIELITHLTEGKRTGQSPPHVSSEERASSGRKLQQKEAELSRLSRSHSMGEMATSIAHEVNQPIAGMLANAEAGLRWLSHDAPNLQGARESLALILRDGNRASAIIRSIREFLGKERGQMMDVDLNELLRDAVAPVRPEFLKRRIVVRMSRFGALPPVRGDRTQLQQVILNLVLNGAQAMASNEGAKELLITSRRSADDYVLVAVRDCGTGIDPGAAERIFDPFFTTKDTGMGLGLSISRSIIEAHGGRIWAQPNEGPGLTVLFTLPPASVSRLPVQPCNDYAVDTDSLRDR